MGATMIGNRLADDVRRMAPVWFLVVVTAVVAVFSIRAAGRSYLEGALSSSPNACAVAEIRLNAGVLRMKEINERVAAKRLADGRLDQSALGLLKDDREVDAALDDFRAAAELCGTNAAPWLYIHQLQILRGDLAAAHHAQGLYEQSLGNTATALIEFDFALAANPQFRQAIVDKAITLRASSPAQALELVNGREAQLAALPRGNAAIGGAFLAANRFAEALPYLKKALEEEPASRERVFDAYFAYTNAAEPAEAAEFLFNVGDKASRTIPDLFDLSASAYRLAGDSDGEIRALRKAVSLFPNSVEINWNLATALHRAGKRGDARRFANRAVEIDLGYVLNAVEKTGVDPRKS